MSFQEKLNLKKIKVDKIQMLLIGLLFIIGCSFTFDTFFARSKQDGLEKAAAADTYIPNGYTLVPIELQNTDSISSLIEEFAVVDLYANSINDKKARKIGTRLRLLRAPLNPERFAVLVPDSQAALILGADGPISASLLNRQQIGQGIVEHEHKTTKLQVKYYQGDI